VPVVVEDIAKTAIITPFGLYEYVYISFGLKNAAQTSQCLVDRPFHQLLFVVFYVDDHLVASCTSEEHLRQFFAILQDVGLRINPAKCVFGAAEMDFLAHRVGAAGISPLFFTLLKPSRSFHRQADGKSLQRFLGLLNCYRRILSGLAGLLQPLTDTLKDSPRHLNWNAEMSATFLAAKQTITSAMLLGHPSDLAVRSLVVDASESYVGPVCATAALSSWTPRLLLGQDVLHAGSLFHVRL
jgi:hypothetical protein